MAVYFILEENDADWRIKIGRSRNPKARTRDLQTGNSRVLKLVGWIDGGSDVATEARLHAKYATYNVAHDGEAASREWFYLQPADILDDLADAGRSGFVARNADAFEIVGYDRDAVPEYVGVWDWGAWRSTSAVRSAGACAECVFRKLPRCITASSAMR